MKVINERSFWPWKLKCQSCASELEAEKEDVEFAFFGANWGGDKREKEYYVTCPVCETDNFVPDKLLTTSVKEGAKPWKKGS